MNKPIKTRVSFKSLNRLNKDLTIIQLFESFKCLKIESISTNLDSKDSSSYQL